MVLVVLGCAPPRTVTPVAWDEPTPRADVVLVAGLTMRVPRGWSVHVDEPVMDTRDVLFESALRPSCEVYARPRRPTRIVREGCESWLPGDWCAVPVEPLEGWVVMLPGTMECTAGFVLAPDSAARSNSKCIPMSCGLHACLRADWPCPVPTQTQRRLVEL